MNKELSQSQSSLLPKHWMDGQNWLSVIASDKADAWQQVYRDKRLFAVNAETAEQKYAGGTAKVEPQADRPRAATEFKINETAYIPRHFYENMRALATDVIPYINGQAQHKRTRQELSPQQHTRAMDEVISWYEKPFEMWWLLGLAANEGQGEDTKFAELRLDAQFTKGISPDKIRQNYRPNLPTGYALIEEAKSKGGILTLSNSSQPQENIRPTQALAELLIVNKVFPPEMLAAFLTSFRIDTDGNTLIPLESAQHSNRRLHKYMNPAWRPSKVA